MFINDITNNKMEASSSVTNEFISNKRELDQFFGTQFEYKTASETRTTTIIGALKMLRSKPFGFNFIDVIQAYIDLLRKDDRIDDDLLRQLKNLIKDFMNVLEPWVNAQTVGEGQHSRVNIFLSEEDRKQQLKSRLKTVLEEKCKQLGIFEASENPSQNFMHEMVQKLCVFFKLRTDTIVGKPDFDINKEVQLGSALYSFLKHYDQLLLPILEQIRIVNKTPEGKDIIKVFVPRIHAHVKGGRRTRHKRSDKRSGKSGHKRSGHKRSGKSGHKSGRR